jgi:hypothetical protein
MHMKLPWLLFIAALPMVAVHGQASDEKAALHVQKCHSAIGYPTEGDESLDVKYAGLEYHLRILHPKVVGGPHFSTPFFWISKAGEIEGDLPDGIVTLKTHIGGLSWHAIRGYFFAENEGALRGFFLEDGFDNADNGSSGLIFLFDGKESTAWRWNYDRDSSKSKGSYRIASADGLANPLPRHLLKALAPLLNLAEKEADAWPGP